MVRTPLNTRFESGHETNCLFGSSMTTSIAGLLRRTYFAAVAPPQPPPMTTTRGPLFGAKSPFSAGAQPPSSPSPRPTPDVPRNARREIVVMTLLRIGYLRAPGKPDTPRARPP